MTVAELNSRVAKLEAKVATLEEELERAQIIAGIQRGVDEADRGLGIPVHEAVEKLRKKYSLPRK